ncbi:Seipin-1 [Nymphaea thermarum]|nr:Seipin-1 [Nymphaea thermarum]
MESGEEQSAETHVPHGVISEEPSYVYTSPSPPPAENDLLILKPAGWAINFVFLHLVFIYRIVSAVSSFFSPLLSAVSDSLGHTDEPKQTAEASRRVQRGVDAVRRAPATVSEDGSRVVRKLVLGLVKAAYLCFVLTAAMVVAVIVGVGLVRSWAEEPVVAEEAVSFDYTEEQPSASVFMGRTRMAVPFAHTMCVSLEMVLPESDYNRDVGMFQIMAEAIASNGAILAKSSQPCMLRFRSFPVRLIRSFFLLIPLVLEISDETQMIKTLVLKYKETAMRTEQIKVRLQARAGTMGLPQIYSARIILNSRPPWKKKLVHSWRLPFYIWSSLYVYIMLLVVLVSCCRRVIFPASLRLSDNGSESAAWSVEGFGDSAVSRMGRGRKLGGESFSDEEGSSGGWLGTRRAVSRLKRRRALEHGGPSDTASCSTSGVTEEGSGDAEEISVTRK